MLSTKAKIILFTTLGVVLALGAGVATVFIRDNDNKSYFTAVEREVEDYCSETVYGTTAYTFKSQKDSYQAKDSTVVLEGYFSNEMNFKDCEYSLLYAENNNFSDLIKCNFECKETNFFEKVMHGIDSTTITFNLEKSFSGQTFFTPVGFIDEDTSTGFLVRNNKFTSCIIKSYLSINELTLEKEKGPLRNGSFLQKINLSIINEGHQKIEKIFLEKDGEILPFEVNELEYSEDKISYFNLLFREERTGYHFVRLKSASFINEFGNELEIPVSSNTEKYTVLEGVALVSSNFQTLTNEKSFSGTLKFRNPSGFTIQKAVISVNGTDFETLVTLSRKEEEFSYYNFSLNFEELEIENGSMITAKVKRFFFQDGWENVDTEEIQITYESPEISSFNFIRMDNGTLHFSIVLGGKLSNLKGAECSLKLGSKTGTSALDINDKKTLLGSFYVGYNSDFSITLKTLTLNLEPSVSLESNLTINV